MLASWNHQYTSPTMQPVQDTTMQLSWVFIAFYNQVFSRSPWFPLVLLSLHTFIRVCPRSPYCVHVLPSKVIIIDFWIDSFCKLNVTFTGLDRWARFPVKARIAGCPRIFLSKHYILYLRIRFVFSWQPTVQCSRICEINKKYWYILLISQILCKRKVPRAALVAKILQEVVTQLVKRLVRQAVLTWGKAKHAHAFAFARLVAMLVKQSSLPPTIL